MSQTPPSASSDAQASRMIPPHPAAASRAYLAMRRWNLGPGRLSGHFVLPLLIGAIPIFILFTVEELCISRVCIPIEGTSVGSHVFRLFWNAYFLFVPFCLLGAIVRLQLRIRLRRRARGLDRLGPARVADEDAKPDLVLARRALDEANARILDPRQHEPQLRAAVAGYAGLSLITGLLMLVNMQDAADFFAEEGYLGGNAAPSSLLCLAFGLVTLRCLLLARRLRRGAQELFDNAEALIDRQRSTLARLLRGEEAQPLPISFRRYGANQSPGTKS